MQAKNQVIYIIGRIFPNLAKRARSSGAVGSLHFLCSLIYKYQPVINGQLKFNCQTNSPDLRGLAIPVQVAPQRCPLPFHQKTDQIFIYKYLIFVVMP